MILENLAFYDELKVDKLKNASELKSWCTSFAALLNMNTAINISFDISPSKSPGDDKNYSILLNKTVNGVLSKLDPLNKHFFSSDSYRDLVDLKLSSFSSSSLSYSLLSDDTPSESFNLKECFNKLISASKNTMTLQRYKGLGEMNPPQLEETTMNVKSRTLLKVLPLEDLNSVVVELMGDDVEPRREFIKQKYSSVKNLDI